MNSVEQTPTETSPRRQVRARPATRGLTSFLRRYGLQAGTVVMAAVLWVILAVGSPLTWLHADIYSALMSTVPVTQAGIIALTLTIVVIAREIDLSFGSVMAVGTWVFMSSHQPELGLIAGLAAGLCVGLLNGVVVVRFGIPSLVATIGSWFFWAGIVLVGTGASGASTDFASGFVSNLLTGRIGGYVPAEMPWMIGIAIALWVLLNRTRFGAHVYLVGDNEQSARMMGVRTGRVRVGVFALMGVAAAFAGIASTLEAHYFWPTVGSGAMLPTVATVFLGGTSIFGGRGTIFGTVVAAFVIGAIEPGIVSLNLTGFYTQVIYGAVIVLALVMQSFVRERSQR
ncbi:MAG: ABC transporter permease [Gaiellaceae bacterium]